MMRSAILILITMYMVPGFGAAQNLLSGPESVVYDSLDDRYFVSNMNHPCYIVAIDHDGSYSIFHDGLQWPHGMTIVDSVIYVTSNVGSRGGIVGLDLHTGEKIYEHLSSSWYNAVYSNLTTDTSGNLYFGVYNRIYRLNLAEDQSYMLPYSFNIPNGIHFDARNNRVLVPCEVYGSAIYAINAADYSLETIPVEAGRYSCITEDQMGNFYMSAFWENEIFRFDASLANRELLVDGLAGPEAIHFNTRHSTLVVPNLSANRIDFIPLDIDLWSTPGDTAGWIPFEVAFGAASIYEIIDWQWDFGDGHTAAGPAPTHTYETPGVYDLTVQAVTTGGDTLTRVYPNHIFCLADSLWTDDIEIASDTAFEVTIYARTNAPLRELRIPLEFSGDIPLEFDSFSTAGCRGETFGGQDIIDTGPSSLTFHLAPRIGSPLYMPPGNGPLLKVYFHNMGGAARATTIALGGYDTAHVPVFVANGITYRPVTTDGVISYPVACGDVNRDESVNVGDGVYIINFVFKGGPSPQPACSGDPNGDESVNVGDAIYIINHVFKNGPPPVPSCCETK